jgi:hypothetical protein
MDQVRLSGRFPAIVTICQSRASFSHGPLFLIPLKNLKVRSLFADISRVSSNLLILINQLVSPQNPDQFHVVIVPRRRDFVIQTVTGTMLSRSLFALSGSAKAAISSCWTKREPLSCIPRKKGKNWLVSSISTNNEITCNIQQVNEVISESSAIASELAASAGELSLVADGLHRLMGNFR